MIAPNLHDIIDAPEPPPASDETVRLIAGIIWRQVMAEMEAEAAEDQIERR